MNQDDAAAAFLGTTDDSDGKESKCCQGKKAGRKPKKPNKGRKPGKPKKSDKAELDGDDDDGDVLIKEESEDAAPQSDSDDGGDLVWDPSAYDTTQLLPLPSILSSLCFPENPSFFPFLW